MKKGLFISVFIALVLCTTLISALTPEQRTHMQECRADCRAVFKNATNDCTESNIECKALCQKNGTCVKTCTQEKTLCTKNASMNFRVCQDTCVPPKDPQRNTCLVGNITYSLRDKFTQGCDICTCNANGKTSCIRDNFCNKNVTIMQDSCSSGGGIYLPLCTGPYYSIVCTSSKYCLCEGNANSTCPVDYSCFHDFSSPVKRKGSLKGFRNLIGQELGDIGVCVKNPVPILLNETL